MQQRGLTRKELEIGKFYKKFSRYDGQPLFFLASSEHFLTISIIKILVGGKVRNWFIGDKEYFLELTEENCESI